MNIKDLISFKRPSSDGALTVLSRTERYLALECKKRNQLLSQKLDKSSNNLEKEISTDMRFLLDLSLGRKAIRGVMANLKRKSLQKVTGKGGFTFVVSSIDLIDWWKYATSDPHKHERLILVYGVETKTGIRVFTRIEKVRMEEQSSVYVKAEETSTHLKIISYAEDFEHYLLGMFHSHMSHGAGATRPSGTDLAHQERLVRIGSEAVGGIFSLDGYFRCFSTCMDFDLEVYGRGVEVIEDKPREKVLRLTHKERKENET